MKTRFCYVLLTIALTMAAQAETPIQFPKVTGKNLLGDEVSFPDAFKGTGRSLAIIAFEQNQQPLVDTWLPQLEILEKEDDEFVFFELPTIKRMNGIMRWVIYRGMRSGIKDERARWRTVTLHIDKAPFRKALEISNEKTIKLFLVDEKGAVLWQSEGEFSSVKLESLKAALRSAG